MDGKTVGATRYGLTLVVPFVLGASGLLGFRAASAAVARPPLAFSAATLDLVKVAPGATIAGTLWLANPSSAPVRIEAVRHSCGCTTSQVADVLPARGRVPFAVRLVAERKLGDERQEAHVYAVGHADPLTLSILVHVLAHPSRPAAKAGGVKDAGESLPCTIGPSPAPTAP